MDINHLKRSMQEIGRTVGAIVEEKLGERSQLEEQVRGIAKQVEKVVSETLWNRQERVTIRFKRLDHFKGDLPQYATTGASGLDVRACIDEPVVLNPMERMALPTGLSVEIPRGFEIQVRPRSGLAVMKGLSVVNAPGTVDADYRGEVKVILINLGQEPITIQDQERIAQLVVCPVIQADLEDVTDLSETERGAGGFGSTGV
jgi:dUTP pyrophosphatase